ncbi:sulfite exporter TauE/SafE family protein [Heliobacterium chlorum]|uniref:Probable membrane transporter protein n=1 Tax=Heliobacterium chlorum TaxID=2698 RepID=A0ABR7SWR9_HELCL|nr:sulfite exporter TauE/SafE family protein [Heliobacterium chlorum]MBC9783002.1 sulfite exporter TauE/SafE family protein [Heliobacterium chlorum]
MEIMLIVVGLLSGILSGLAVGGGTLLVPALILLMDVEQHQAQAVALTAFLPMSAVALVTHFKNGNVRPRLAFLLALTAVIGAVGGASLAAYLPGPVLRKVFGIFLVAMGAYEIFYRPKRQADLTNGKQPSERQGNP